MILTVLALGDVCIIREENLRVRFCLLSDKSSDHGDLLMGRDRLETRQKPAKRSEKNTSIRGTYNPAVVSGKRFCSNVKNKEVPHEYVLR